MTEAAPLKVLLVEDDPDIQTVTQMALELGGHFSVTVCGSGEEALLAAAEGEPDLVLLDAGLPDLDGPGTMRALRAVPATAETPVIFLTANTQTLDVTKYLRLGALEVIQKPFDPTALPTAILRILETARR